MVNKGQSTVFIDMNHPGFQEQLFNLEKVEQRALLNTLRKMKQLTWDSLYLDKGIRWELITSNLHSRDLRSNSVNFTDMLA